MIQSIEQLPLPQRIPILKNAVITVRSRLANDRKEEAKLLDLLAQAEAALGANPDKVELSGLIDDNPHLRTGGEPVGSARKPDQSPAGKGWTAEGKGWQPGQP